MAVMQQKLYFGGVDSSTYGVYISGEAIFNAPKRAVTMVSVPGRNGAVAIDQGHWENIEVKYPAFISASSLATLSTNLANFRNAIVSQVGYNRLTDTINSTEYRMAVYVDGLEFEPVGQSTTVTFELTFQCKPQRWLTSGEGTLIGISSGSTISNPTKYDAYPLLAVSGYGTINFNGYEIEVDNDTYGEIVLLNGQTIYTSGGLNKTFQFISGLYNSVDYITLPDLDCWWHISGGVMTTDEITSSTVTDSGAGTTTAYTPRGLTAQYRMVIPGTSFVSSSNKTITSTATCEAVTIGGTTERFTVTFTIKYTASTRKLQFIVSSAVVSQTNLDIYTDSIKFDDITVNSSASVLGTPTYIDCDIGEAYKVSNGNTIGLNAYIDLGSILPCFASGSNTITFDNTITSILITPRWWML